METWRAMDARVALRRAPTRDQDRTRMLGWKIKFLLHRDRQRQAAESGDSVESLLASDLPLVK